ncbi:CPBP family intramembrane glutamic endopeptidase [Candidatus Protochlamydia phocaeensis]|uniref:CPBP family intramembrane glutamic endopeptidase n=1 Tax=Candidatus Protochlamydia phocaeensis TaxID=1414722 RepID=UPI000838EB00|nr:CPBP family intramembrane glutamic endopeptidase [Candidatus Protochlamydia phocaeensis]
MNVNPQSMPQAEQLSFTARYVYPVISHPLSRQIYRIVAEAVKIVASVAFLDMMVKRLFNKDNGVDLRLSLFLAVSGPIFEEIFFRGVIQGGIALCQTGWHKFVVRREPTEDELRIQRTVRVRLSAVIFTFTHLINLRSNVTYKLIQMAFCYTSGLAYGYLSDKYKTVSFSILGHGFHNIISIYIRSGPTSLRRLCIGISILNLAAIYVLGTTNIGEYMAGCVGNALGACAAMPRRLVSWLNPPASASHEATALA